MKKRVFIFTMILCALLTGCTDDAEKMPQPSATPKTGTQETIVVKPRQTQKLTGEKANFEECLFDTPNSTCFSRIGYIEQSELLVVEFRNSGSIYEYSCFTEEDWNSFSSADSLGGYYNKQIKGNYPCERIY